VEEFAAKPDLESAGWLPRLRLDEVVDYEKWDHKDDPEWKRIRELVESNLATLK